MPRRAEQSAALKKFPCKGFTEWPPIWVFGKSSIANRNRKLEVVVTILVVVMMIVTTVIMVWIMIMKVLIMVMVIREADD